MVEISDLETTDANNTGRWPEGMVGAQVNNSGRAMEGYLARWFNDTNGSLTSGGSSNAYTLSPNRTIGAYYDGLPFVFEANHTNTGAATLQLSGLSAKDIRRTDDSALTGGEIVSGGKYFVVFDSSTDRWQLMNPTTIAAVDITNRTAETDPAAGDELLIEDVSVGANRKMTFTNFMKVITDLTAETSPATDDELALYDTDGSATDKITLQNLLKVINALTEDTDPDETADFLLTYDASASAAKKSKIEDVVKAQAKLRQETEQTASGDSNIDFTSIPSGVNRIFISFDNLSVSGTDDVLVQLGDSGGFETSGYNSGSLDGGGSSHSTSGFIVRNQGDNNEGLMTLIRMSGNKWAAQHGMTEPSGNDVRNGGGLKQLSAELDRVRITASGSNTISGNIGLVYGF